MKTDATKMALFGVVIVSLFHSPQQDPNNERDSTEALEPSGEKSEVLNFHKLATVDYNTSLTQPKLQQQDFIIGEN